MRRRRRSTGRDETGERVVPPPEWAGLAIFALLVTLAPLAFGAGDQLVQAILLVLFAAGLAVRPPTIQRPSPRTNALLGALAVFLILKEFAPAALFGSTHWRTLLTSSFQLELPWTHHPEPGRAVDALLSAGLAILWLLWVRTMAGKRENRAWLAWALAGSAAVVSVVSFLTQTKDGTAIYGLRYTPGWHGFGPFPNRNHTACYLAMGAVMSSGLAVWAIVRRSTPQIIVAVLFALISVAGVLATQSRGGILALCAGLAIYAAFCLAKFRDRRVFAVVAALGLVGVTVALAGGSSLFSRFGSSTSTESNLARVAIWHETLKMWGDAPLFGHGARAFASIFPLYSELSLDNGVVLHPESSWLLWLVEMGAIPVLLAVAAAGAWAWGRARATLKSQRSFFIYAAGFASAGALLCHSAIDIPGHRWPTAAFALAAIALAFPKPKPSTRELEWNLTASPRVVARRSAVVPLAIAVFWVLPIAADWPAWSPLSLQRQLALAGMPHGSSAGLLPLAPYFPLNADLHHDLGLAKLEAGAPEAEWMREFEIADRLSPNFWGQPILQARACARRSPDAAFHLWQLAIEHGGRRAEEIFVMAFQETARLPRAQDRWGLYVSTHPSLALEFVGAVERETALPIFQLWWLDRGSNPEVALSPHEAQVFYGLAPRFSNADDFSTFMRLRPALVVRDFFPCARVLHAFGDDARAWQLLSTRFADPEVPPARSDVSRLELERRVRSTPDSAAAAQALASACLAQGDQLGAQMVLLAFAERPTAPPFFTRKGAWILKAEGRLTEAVEMMLRESPGK